MIQQLTELIEQLKKATDETGLKVSDESIFEQACGFLRGQYANQRYNQPVKSGIVKPKEDKTETKHSDFSNNPLPNEVRQPTDKQIYFLQKNNQEIPKTFEEACQIINKLKGGQNGRN